MNGGRALQRPQGVLSSISWLAIQSLMIFHGLFSQRRANGRFMSHSGVISLSASDPTPSRRWRCNNGPGRLTGNHRNDVAARPPSILAMASGVTWPPPEPIRGGRGPTSTSPSGLEMRKSKAKIRKTLLQRRQNCCVVLALPAMGLLARLWGWLLLYES